MSSTEAGWTAGVGLEYAFAPNWTAKAEYLFVDLANASCGFANCGGTNTTGPAQREHHPRRRKLQIRRRMVVAIGRTRLLREAEEDWSGKQR